MKLKSDALEAWELEQWRNKRQADLCQRESKFKHGKAQVLRERKPLLLFFLSRRFP